MNAKKEKAQSKHQSRFPRWLTAVLVYMVSIAAVLVVLYGGFSVAFANQIYPRVTVAGVMVGGMKADAAKQKLQTELSNQTLKPVLLTDNNGHSFSVKPESVSAAYDVDGSVASAMAVGRSRDWLGNLSQKLTTPIFGYDLPAKVEVDDVKLGETTRKIADQVDVQEKNADLKIVKGMASVTPSIVGQHVDLDVLKDQILSSLGRGQTDPIALKIKQAEPAVKANGVDEAKKAADAILADKILFTYNGQTFVASTTDIGGWLKTQAVTKLFKSKIDLSFNEDAITSYIDSISAKIDQDAQDARVAVVNGQVTIIDSSKDGVRVKRDQAKADVLRLLSLREQGALPVASPSDAVVSPSPAATISLAPTPSPSAGADIATNEVVLETEVKKPEITNDNINQIGIKERIAVATTDFRGSPDNRQTNIKLGTKLFNGIILKPGEQFSAIKSLGRIDETSGFKPELVIKEDQLTPEVGGGLCQVSTTLFRAAMNAGLQIDERRNHKERVGYYESRPSNPDPEDYVTINAKTLVGMDATIYDPSPDFKFTNDTDHYMLIQGRVDGTRLTFELFGTKDGRKTAIDGPYILSTTPAPTDVVYIDDPTMPAGQTKAKENAHPGAKTSFTYVVTKDGKQLHKNTFTSTYQAWQAKFYRGTGPAAQPSPVPTDTPAASPSPTQS